MIADTENQLFNGTGVDPMGSGYYLKEIINKFCGNDLVCDDIG